MIIHLSLIHAALPWVYIGFYSKYLKGWNQGHELILFIIVASAVVSIFVIASASTVKRKKIIYNNDTKLLWKN